MPAAPSTSKGKSTERPPSRDAPTAQSTLQQLKTDIENSPGVVKNATEARNFLIQRQWSLNEQKITWSHLATILLSLVSIQGQWKSLDKLPDAAANTVKAVAFLLEEAVIAQYADQITVQLPSAPNNVETASQLKETLDNINTTIQERMDAFGKTIEDIKAALTPPHTVNNHSQANADYTYRDALMNNQNPALQPPANAYEARLRNRINIDACQVLIEIQTDGENPIRNVDTEDNKSTGKIKIAANHWLANRDVDDPSPPNTIIRSITLCRNKKLLLEANTPAAADWIKQNAPRILNPLIGHPVKTLDRKYPVIARYMPVLFKTNEEGAHKLESSANLPENSISQVSWIKNPERRSRGQQFANVKILCNSAVTANNLILSSGRISHLGSQIQFHKDIKAPGTCNKCQRYGHTLPNCTSANPICAKCAGNHYAHECRSRSTKCTPCGSTEHQTNDETCIERIEREKDIMLRKPELLTPYYITAERWTWGLPSNTPKEIYTDTTHQNRRTYRNNNRQRNNIAGPSRTQASLLDKRFNFGPKQTGANSIPIKPKNTTNIRSPSPARAQVRSPSPQRTNTAETPTSPQPNITPQ